jgi:hypothetical protein
MADAPLGGTPVQAEAGELSTMVGASDEVFRRLEPVIRSWARTVVHLGPCGSGHKMKLLNNFLSLGYAALYSEALALSEKVGITTKQFDSVIRGSRMDCGFYQTFMGYAVEGNRESHKFTLTNALKDMRYLEAMADSVSLANPIGNAVKNSLAMACAAGGDGPDDYLPHLVDFVRRGHPVGGGDGERCPARLGSDGSRPRLTAVERMSITIIADSRETVGVNMSVFSSVSATMPIVQWASSGPREPVMPMVVAPRSRATRAARTTSVVVPVFEIATATSPGPSIAAAISIWCPSV